jgi:predicted lipoprotein with Yx(FWY)xxD motif
MIQSPSAPRRRASRRLSYGVLVTVAVLGLAACGGPSSGQPAASSSSSTSASGASNAAITVATANVPGLGTVLVNGSGRTLYLLTSEQGGRLTCTDENGCTRVWPDTELPAGTTRGIAGAGVEPSMLGTLRASGGSLYLTYAGWPLYTYSGDSGPGQARGQGIVSFGGTWEALSPAGSPVAATGSSSTGTSTSSGGGY